MSGSAPYLIAGFVLTWAVLALYAWRLESRLRDARDRLDRRGGEGSRGAGRAAPGSAGRETGSGEAR